MNPILARLTQRLEIGLSIGEREVAACAMAVSPIRRVEVGTVTVPYEAEGLAAAIKEALDGCAKGRDLSAATVTIGLPSLRLFFSTRPLSEKGAETSPMALLHSLIQSPNLVLDDMDVDMIKTKSGGQTLGSVVSCRKKYLLGLLSALESCGIVPVRAEPMACALARRAAKKGRPPRKAQGHVRVFLGKDEGLAVLLTKAELPLTWRPFELPAGGEAEAVLAAVATVRVLARPSGLQADVGAVMIHGRPDLAGLDLFPSLGDLKVQRHDGPGLDEAEAARALAAPANPNYDAFNLVRSLGLPAKFLDIFPWGQAVLQAGLLVAATFFLQYRLASHRAADSASRKENDKYAWAKKITVDKLKTEKKDLEDRIESTRSFLSTRILWTSYARSLAGRLTPDLSIVSLTGAFDLEVGGSKSRPKRSLIIRLNTPIPRTGEIPPEIDAFLNKLRKAPLLQKDFPDVNLGDLRWTQGSGRATANATFSVVCQPAKAPAPKADGAAKDKDKGKGH